MAVTNLVCLFTFCSPASYNFPTMNRIVREKDSGREMNIFFPWIIYLYLTSVPNLQNRLSHFSDKQLLVSHYPYTSVFLTQRLYIQLLILYKKRGSVWFLLRLFVSSCVFSVWGWTCFQGAGFLGRALCPSRQVKLNVPSTVFICT